MVRLDLEETARITGKDLSGPPPEIRVHVRTAMGVAPETSVEEPDDNAQKDADGEIVMSIEEYEKQNDL